MSTKLYKGASIRRPKWLKALLISFLILTVICVVIGMFVISLFYKPHRISTSFLSYFWIFFFFIPFPIATAILGFYTWKAYPRVFHAPNIITGIFFTFVYTVFGLLPTFMPLHNDVEFTREISNRINLQLPENIQVDVEKSTVLSSYSTLQAAIKVDFYSDEEAKKYESKLDELEYIDSIPEKFNGLIKSSIKRHQKTEEADKYLFINYTANEKNKLPDTTGIYEFYVISYSTKYDNMVINQISLNYFK